MVLIQFGWIFHCDVFKRKYIVRWVQISVFNWMTFEVLSCMCAKQTSIDSNNNNTILSQNKVKAWIYPNFYLLPNFGVKKSENKCTLYRLNEVNISKTFISDLWKRNVCANLRIDKIKKCLITCDKQIEWYKANISIRFNSIWLIRCILNEQKMMTKTHICS